MSCIVPTCLGKGRECSTRTFPHNSALARRWLRSIQIGCQLGGGTDPVMAMIGLEDSSICDAHFDCHHGRVLNDLYVEPTIFCDSQGRTVTVLTCSMCLEFYTKKEFLRCDQILNQRTVQFDTIEKLLGTKNYSSTFVCMECVAKLEIISSVCSFFELCRKSIQSLEEIINKVVEDNFDKELRRGANVNETIKLEPEDIRMEELATDTNVEISIEEECSKAPLCQKKKLITHKKFSCKICQNGFKSKTTLDIHMTRIHPNENPFEGEVCRETFQIKQSLVTHQESHSNEEKTYETSKNLSSHSNVNSKICAKVHLKNMQKNIASVIIKCKKCDLNFDSEGDFRQHSSEIHGDEKPFSCDKCNTSFKWKTSLDTHMSRLHPYEKPFYREIERGAFQIVQNLVTHQEPHSNGNNLQCRICHKTFETRKGLKMHSIVHSKHERFECKICGKVFDYKSGLKFHLKNTHKNIASVIIKCKKCDSNFFSEAEVQSIASFCMQRSTFSRPDQTNFIFGSVGLRT
ncbi:zinc finger protein 809-like [Uranotaenia lowii]|uniref:zinc finger protein 809-like n=1 Tax=Uranotaenia lowii TaxID=190385 RepID=UPI00247A11D0|nr:zinc finger protein 809-like [Uranotaenia lowii]XP_055602429.1 zinc finger protein 809-like [Uranotaenia lowii]